MKLSALTTLYLIACFSFAACNNSGSSDTSEDNLSEEDTVQEKPEVNKKPRTIKEKAAYVRDVSSKFIAAVNTFESAILTDEDTKNSAAYVDAYGIKQKINQARMDMLSVLDNTELRDSFDRTTSLRAEDPLLGNNDWVSYYIINSPPQGVRALLAKTKADCKNLEADILHYLVSQMEKEEKQQTDIITI